MIDIDGISIANVNVFPDTIAVLGMQSEPLQNPSNTTLISSSWCNSVRRALSGFSIDIPFL